MKRNLRSSSSKLTLFDSIRIGDLKTVYKLVSKDNDINMKENSDDGLTPLILAAMYGHKEILKILLNAKASVNLPGNGGDLALAVASTVSIAKILINAGADVNFENQFGYSVLLIAIRKGNHKIIKYLLFCGANLNSPSYSDYTPLHVACTPLMCEKKCNKKTVKYLLQNHADINSLSIENYTPLMTFLDYSFDNFEVGSSHPVDEKSKKFLRYLLKYLNVDSVTIGLFPREKLYETYLQHVAKLLALDIPVNSHYNVLQMRPNYTDHFQKCNHELLVAKNTKVLNSWITYFNLLVDNKKKLKNYAGNKELIASFEETDVCKKFPIYGNMMKENVKKGIKRRTFYDKSTLLLSNCLKIYGPTHLIVRDTLDYLNLKDLLKFCKK